MGIRTRTIAAQVANSFSNATNTQTLTPTANVTFEKLTSNTSAIATANITTASITTANVTTINAGSVGVSGNLAINSAVTTNTIEVGGVGGYGTVTTTQFASVFAKANGFNATSLMQVKGNDGTVGMGMRAVTGGTSLIYSNGQIDFRVGSTIRDLDTPTGGTTYMTLGTTGVLTLSSNTTSTSTTTGALVVTGGVGIGGNLYVTDTVTTTLNVTGSANVAANLTANNVRTNGSVQIDGDLTVSGNTVTVNATNLSLEDNMIYLNANNAVSHPDLGIAGNYNDGTYRHAGVFRDATDARWKFFDQYVPEPDASAYIDTANNTFRIADVQANTLYAANGVFTSGVSGITTLAVGNTTITGFANVTSTLQLNANVVLGTTTITANGGVGTAGQVLTSGATGNVYWSTVATTLDAVLGIGNTTTKALTTGTLTVNGAIRTTTAFIENATAVTADYTITANTNAMTAGPISIANTATVTIPSDSNWIIL